MTDWEFVFDGVVGFLTSPMWNVPIVTFIEKNCVVFEPTDENELTFTEIHKEYGALVEELLTSYLKDVGITEEQFVSACEAGSNDSSKVPDRSIFEQVWAGEDFKLFKKIMVKQNLDLELQALHMIQERNGVVPKVFVSESLKKQPRQRSQNDEEKLLKEIMERSRQDYENEKGKKKEIERMEKTLALSKEESERLHKLAEQELNELERMVKLSLRLENARGKEKTSNTEKKTNKSSESKPSSPKNKGKPAEVKLSGKTSTKESPKTAVTTASKKQTKNSSPQPGSVPAKSLSTKQNSETSSMTKAKSLAEQTVTKSKNKAEKTPDPVKANPSSPPKRQDASQLPSIKVPQRTPAEAAADWISSAKAEAGPADTSSSNPTESKNHEKAPVEDEIKKRAEYMRIQRDKLLKLKTQEREKRLQTFEDELPVKRPTSSRVAHREAVSERTYHGVKAARAAATPDRSEANEQQQKTLALRRVLAESLKKEVIKGGQKGD